ncbi:hypothetical protein BgiMline_034532 [Biomphalaria glabrata]|nr:hypothetical protein BgiMline_020678 [Biomphalaria glabrata]
MIPGRRGGLRTTLMDEWRDVTSPMDNWTARFNKHTCQRLTSRDGKMFSLPCQEIGQADQRVTSCPRSLKYPKIQRSLREVEKRRVFSYWKFHRLEKGVSLMG